MTDLKRTFLRTALAAAAMFAASPAVLAQRLLSRLAEIEAREAGKRAVS